MPRGRKLESFKDYQRALKQKYGVGQGIDYKPWLRIQDVKSEGTRSLIFGRKVQRNHHMMSSIESEFFHLAEFMDNVIDIREQFPILPLNLTQKVAHVLGVKHPTHPKTKEPIIVTTDQLLTIKGTNGISYHAVSVKPESESDKLRVLEKIDIERVCWELLGVKFNYFTGNELTRTQSSNIAWATAPFRENPVLFSNDQINYMLSNMKLGQVFIEDLCNNLISAQIVSHDDALSLIGYLVAEKYIDVDLSFNIPESGILDIKGISVAQKGVVYGTS
ncbi:TnsA endonuclease N-terminal domain-containing protein [Moritella sp. 36]|uniref:TnsA endonuclease N-terminal domain-containing protein n=1 Tax=Moritella sp. 36 TaxID=2746233 RepID=UPI001BA85C67|nr:TnsA endonuclease N-terminal domain-containing protein [Moritella sp. 36]QUM87421.1 TnsA endonuclease N-terminal domain-containing protein [Moritella sp. 36]